MSISERQLLHFLSRTPFIDSAELARILGEPHATVHRALAGLLAEGITGRVSHGTAHLASSQRYHLTANGIRETAGFLGFDTPSDFVRAYPMSREWLTLLIRAFAGKYLVSNTAVFYHADIAALSQHLSEELGHLGAARQPAAQPVEAAASPSAARLEPINWAALGPRATVRRRFCLSSK